MKLEQQVTNLELSKKLKELGVEQESLFVWYPVNKDASEYALFDWNEPAPIPLGMADCFSAFTVAELGEMLPWDIVISRNIDKEWIVTFQADGRTDKDTVSFIGTETAARAKMLICLIENDLIGAGSN